MYFKRIKYLREDNDLTQNQISEILNIKRGIYTAMENGQVSFPLNIIEQLSDYYNVSIDYLVELTDNKRYTLSPQKANYNTLGKQLRKVRRKLRLSQKKFCI